MSPSGALAPHAWDAAAASRPHQMAWESDRSRISTDARLVATGTPCTSQTFSRAWMSGSWGWVIRG
ncbi:MAG: hypothetical protein ACRDG9_08680, partial [Actinomycetota bacterium]